jgi:hypothetical protein
MKPVYQTIFKPPLGNCLQACLASLFELPLANVPNFMEAKDWWDEYCNWMVENHALQPLALDATTGDWLPRGWHMIQGKSPRGDYDHIVVGHDGRIVHDPFPNGDPLEDIKYYDVFVSILRANA